MTTAYAEYKVGLDGSIQSLQIKSKSGEPYKITGRRVSADRADQFTRQSRAYDRWAPFRTMVVRQGINEWHEYGPFIDEKEMLYAKASITKKFNDLKAAHPGCKVETRLNKKDLSLLVRIKPEKKTAVPRQNGEANEVEVG